MSPPAGQHNRLKLPLFVTLLVCGVAMAVGGALTGVGGLVIPGVVVVLVTLPAIWVVVTGRGNPWWLRSPRDPGFDGAPRGQRTRLLLALAGSLGFVVVSVALLVVGVATGRSRFVFLGLLGCLVFGACAWFAVAFLRGRA